MVEDPARICDGKILVFRRGGRYHARIGIGPNKYLYRSLKTANRGIAIREAQRLGYEMEFRAEHGIPASSKRFHDVIEEYLAHRRREHLQGRTSSNALRQIERVGRFWLAFAGDRLLTDIGNAELREFVSWRRDYYTTHPFKHHNAKRYPQDKTIQWDVMLGKAIIKWAHERGYRGTMQLPTYSFTAKRKRVRPAFEVWEYRRLVRALFRWVRDCTVPEFLHTRLLLRDYVLFLANSGMRVGEANNLRIRDIHPFVDQLGRRNYRLVVRGKTGERDVIPRWQVTRYIDRIIAGKADPQQDDWLFAMKDGHRIITLIDQFDKVAKLAGIERSSAGEKYSLYSLRHFYAVQSLRKGIGVYDIARNMGTSVEMIQQYYGRQATPLALATSLGGGLGRMSR